MVDIGQPAMTATPIRPPSTSIGGRTTPGEIALTRTPGDPTLEAALALPFRSLLTWFGHLGTGVVVFSALRRTAMACEIAARVACVSRSELSIMKSWVMPP